MFRITEDPSSGRLVQCLAKNYTTDSIVSHDTDMVSFMAVYCDRLCVCVCACVVHFIGRLPLAVPSYTLNYTHNMLP